MTPEYLATMEQYRLYLRTEPEWRNGQCLFNAVRTCWPFAAEQIRGTDLDPFYQDSRVPMTIEYLARLASIGY